MVLTATCFQDFKAMGTFLGEGTWFYFQCAVLDHSVVSNSVTPWTVACQSPLFMGILQARILEWVAMPSSRGSSQPRDQPVSLMSPALAGEFFTTSASWEAHGALIYCTETPVQLSMFN